MIRSRFSVAVLAAVCCLLAASCSSWRNGRVHSATRAAVRADLDLTKQVDTYRQKLAALESGITSPVARRKWKLLVAAAESAQSALLGSGAPIQVIEELKNHHNRYTALDDLSEREQDEEEDDVQDQLLTPERALWDELREVLATEVLVPALERRSELFERKYFHDPADQGGNFLEGWLNSAIPLFRSDQLGDQNSEWSQYANVSPWEGTLRIEPIADVANGSIGMLGTIGVTRHLFPEQDTAGDFWSNTVQRVGLRAGLGAIEERGETVDTIFGAGLQLRSVSVWLLWNNEQDDLTVGLGASDFEWISETVTAFD